MNNDQLHNGSGVYIKDLWYIVESVKANFGIDAPSFDIQLFKYACDIYRDLTLANVMKTAIRTTHIEIPKKELDFENEMEPQTWPPLGPPQAHDDHDRRKRQIRLNLPPDFIDWVKVGTLCAGYIQPLDYNEDICLLNVPINNCCGKELEECLERDRVCNCSGEGIPGGFVGLGYYDWGFSPFWKNGQFVAGAYGKSAYRYRGAFNIDWQTMEIVLDRCTHPRKGIVLEYMSNGIGKGNANITDTMVPAMMAGVEWKKTYYEVMTKPDRLRSKIDMALIATAKHEYRVEIKRANARKNAMSKDEILNAVRRSIHQSVKR